MQERRRNGAYEYEFIDLRNENLGSLDHFVCWWKEQFVTKKFNGQETGALQTLLSILVCQKTETTTSGGGQRLSDQVLPFKMFSHVYNVIDKQRVLQQSHHKVSGTKNPKKKAINNEVVVKTSDKPNLAILEQQFLFLNREQLIWEGPYHQVFSGEPGCGKTILLQLKALECARKGEKVAAMVPTSLVNLYKDFFTRHGVSHLTQVLPLFELAYCTDSDHHWFVDEFQLFIIYFNLDLKNLKIIGKDRYYWIGYNDRQLLPFTVFVFQPGIQDGECKGSEEIKQLNSWLKNLCGSFGFYHGQRMATVMRSTREIHDFVQEYVKASNVNQPATHFGVSVPYLVKLGHQICGPAVTVHYLKAGVMTPTFCQDIIQKEINNWTGNCLHIVVILFLDEILAQALCIRKNMRKAGIPVCKVEDNENAVVVGIHNKIHS